MPFRASWNTPCAIGLVCNSATDIEPADCLTIESGGSLTRFGSLTMVPVTNPFVPANLRTILASRPNASAPFTWNGRYVGVPYKNRDEDYTIQQYLVGARGEIASGWTFDVFAS